MLCRKSPHWHGSYINLWILIMLHGNDSCDCWIDLPFTLLILKIEYLLIYVVHCFFCILAPLPCLRCFSSHRGPAVHCSSVQCCKPQLFFMAHGISHSNFWNTTIRFCSRSKSAKASPRLKTEERSAACPAILRSCFSDQASAFPRNDHPPVAHFRLDHRNPTTLGNQPTNHPLRLSFTGSNHDRTVPWGTMDHGFHVRRPSEPSQYPMVTAGISTCHTGI
jgi:hypothetical protein